ncbi:hypothetical protein KP509_19G007000 [Ceratopteris richardii]|nr:hypothetical protein KP509_19G007000 [Ceratopteris richardii]
MSDTKDQEATQRTEKISLLASEEQKESDRGLKDKVSQLSVHSKDEESRNVSAENLPGGYAGNKPSTSGKADEKLNVPQEQKDGSVNTKEPEFIHSESVSVSNRPSLLEAYYLNQRITQGNEQHTEKKNDSSPDVPRDTEEYERVKETDFVNRVHTESAPNIVDVLELVHAAERRQAELDAQVHEEANKKLKQAFQKELKNAQAREAMYADEVNNLAREIMLEKEKAASALELERKMAEEKLLEELRHKEEEADLKLKKAELLSKSEIAAAVAEEKLTYMKDVRNVKQELEALHMILSTQSEDFHQSHTVHKLAVGAFALEDAMKRGGPLNKEITLISSSYGDSGSDPLLDAVISCLPEAAIKRGTLTPSQLSQKFEDLKSEVLELSLIPSTGGGLISHVAAKLVSAMKVKESGRHSGGIAAAVSKVQCYLAEGKLSDAAEVLENGVQGTKAEVVVADWVKSARDRAVMEQMLLLLQAHATATASSLA